MKTAFLEPESPSVTLASFAESEGAAAADDAAETTRNRATTPNASCALTTHVLGRGYEGANRPMWCRSLEGFRPKGRYWIVSDRSSIAAISAYAALTFGLRCRPDR